MYSNCPHITHETHREIRDRVVRALGQYNINLENSNYSHSCKKCTSSFLVHLCLSCFNVACFKNKHHRCHYNDTNHQFAYCLDKRIVYCFVCGRYVNDKSLDDIENYVFVKNSNDINVPEEIDIQHEKNSNGTDLNSNIKRYKFDNNDNHDLNDNISFKSINSKNDDHESLQFTKNVNHADDYLNEDTNSRNKEPKTDIFSNKINIEEELNTNNKYESKAKMNNKIIHPMIINNYNTNNKNSEAYICDQQLKISIKIKKKIIKTNLIDVINYALYNLPDKIYKKLPCTVFKGATNLGNTCYINSLLQILLSIIEFKKEILKIEHNCINGNKNTIQNIFYDTILDMYSHTGSMMHSNLLYYLCKNDSSYKGSLQFDVHELFLKLCDAFHNEACQNKNENNVNQTNSNILSCSESLREYKTINNILEDNNKTDAIRNNSNLTLDNDKNVTYNHTPKHNTLELVEQTDKNNVCIDKNTDNGFEIITEQNLAKTNIMDSYQKDDVFNNYVHLTNTKKNTDANQNEQYIEEKNANSIDVINHAVESNGKRNSNIIKPCIPNCVSHTLFYGSLYIEHECCDCKNITLGRNDNFFDLSLSINDSDLQSIIEGYFKDDIFEEQMFCINCNKYTHHKKITKIINHPQILVINLKRFKINNLKTSKITDDIYNNLRIELGHVKYKLHGYIKHIGNLSDGHYVSVIKSDKFFYLFDDDKVTSIKAEKALNDEAYLLFYIKNK